jgi:hypothetical protein
MSGDRIAVVVPGAGYTAEGPLLAYARLALDRRGAETRVLSWSLPSFDDAGKRAVWVRDQVVGVLGTSRALIIGKSLASLAAGLVAERGLQAIWFTPLLKRPEVVEAITAAAHPPLLVGGTGDQLWDGSVARRLSPHVVEIPEGDHALYVPGPVSRTAEVAARVMDAMEEFLDEQAWAR